MKVLLVNPAGGLGGSERSLVDLVHSLGAARPELHVGLLALEDGELVSTLRRLGIACDVLELPPALAELGESSAAVRAGTLRALLRAAGSAPGYLAGFRRRVQALAPDIVHTNGMKAHALALATLRDYPLVLHLRDFASARRFSRHLFRWVPERALVVTNSRAVETDVLGLTPGLRTRVVLNGVDTSVFAPGPADPALLAELSGLPTPPPGALAIGLVATYAFWKGHDVFLSAAGELRRALPGRELRFYVIGGPTYATRGSEITEDDLRLAIAREGLEGAVGLVPFRADVANVFRSLDIVVHSSTRPEPFGRTIAEAMASGKPVVVSRAGGAVELFEEARSGLGFTPGDPRDLARVLRKLADDDALRLALGQAARRSALEHFDRARLGPEIVRLYDELVAGR